jgi:hypothetical protein
MSKFLIVIDDEEKRRPSFVEHDDKLTNILFEMLPMPMCIKRRLSIQTENELNCKNDRKFLSSIQSSQG